METRGRAVFGSLHQLHFSSLEAETGFKQTSRHPSWDGRWREAKTGLIRLLCLKPDSNLAAGMRTNEPKPINVWIIYTKSLKERMNLDQIWSWNTACLLPLSSGERSKVEAVPWILGVGLNEGGQVTWFVGDLSVTCVRKRCLTFLWKIQKGRTHLWKTLRRPQMSSYLQLLCLRVMREILWPLNKCQVCLS